MTSAAHRSSIEDLLAIPEDERFHELLDGQLVRKASPSFEHGDAQSAVCYMLFGFRRASEGSRSGWWLATEVEVQLGEHVCRPDVAGWLRERVPERPRGMPVTVAPDWTCEILSASNRRVDLVRKKRIYHQQGVAHYWIIDPEQETLTVHRWHPDGYVEVLVAEKAEVVRAEPFQAMEIRVGVLFGDDDRGAQTNF